MHARVHSNRPAPRSIVAVVKPTRRRSDSDVRFQESAAFAANTLTCDCDDSQLAGRIAPHESLTIMPDPRTHMGHDSRSKATRERR
jgi:hypothetical protein